MKIKVSNPPSLSICDYAVAFVDLLGQKAEMPGRYLPEDREEAIKLVKQSVGKIVRTQKLFQNFYEGFARSSEQSIYLKFSEDSKSQLPDMAPGSLKWQNFSDGFVIYIPLGNGLVSSPCNSIFAMLLAAGALCCAGLAAKAPVRAGIDVGWAVEYRPNELYGAALAYSYHLESQVAQWPRVVVGEGLIEYLRHYAASTGEDPNTRFRKLMAETCISLLGNDTDGRVIVDYLGEGFANAVRQRLDEKVIGDAQLFVDAQFDHWKLVGDPKLARRYAELKRYFDKAALTHSSQ